MNGTERAVRVVVTVVALLALLLLVLTIAGAVDDGQDDGSGPCGWLALSAAAVQAPTTVRPRSAAPVKPTAPRRTKATAGSDIRKQPPATSRPSGKPTKHKRGHGVDIDVDLCD
ncbi:hypothetical protein [Streptomyces sulphureus]|uniref:hypothetical protein n=1 Tax=Streptomyces sulphureus TaxID=47758 RepID=UPI00036BB419|nr:hypothetical protein [Streptomyces sulphureus]